MLTKAQSKNLGVGIAAAVQRQKDTKRMHKVVLEAEFPGNGSQVGLDWWLRQVNSHLGELNIKMKFVDTPTPQPPPHRNGEGESSSHPYARLKHQLEDAQAYIRDLEEHMSEKVEQKVEEVLGRRTEGLSAEEQALRDVEATGRHIDEHGQEWVDIATAAKRKHKSYITVWRAVKEKTKNRIASWVVGTTAAGGDRILVRPDSWMEGKK